MTYYCPRNLKNVFVEYKLEDYICILLIFPDLVLMWVGDCLFIVLCHTFVMFLCCLFWLSD